ncbi:MAG: hemerythrin domain-containing protein, partial [Acidimicrobiaceae bacterium]|nr:hemerythrin domain-containing protein [Acidimicrobiaceae bacterium]
MTDALEFISHQHAQLQTLAAPLGIALASEEALDERAVSELVAAVSVHDAIERGHIFPLVAERLGRERLLAAIDAHGRQARILSEIERRPADDPHRRTLVGDIVEAVHYHVHDEQTMLSLLRGRMAPEELERVGASMEAALPRVPTRPHPHLGGSGGGARLSARLFAPVDHVRDRLRRRPRPPSPPSTPSAPRRVDILRVLERQHREMARVLEDLITTGGDEIARRHLTDYVVGAMARHESAEELVLWPAVRRRVPGGGPLVDEAL